jgi:hypothetical protein
VLYLPFPRSFRIIRPGIFPALVCCAAAVLVAGCARFRIEELEPQPVFSTPIVRADLSNAEGRVQLMESGRVPFNLPVRPALSRSLAVITDPGRRLVRIFPIGNSESPEVILGGGPADATPGSPVSTVKRIALKAGIPGWAAIDEDGEHLFIQSFPIVDSPDAAATTDDSLARPPVENRPARQISIIKQQAAHILHLDPEENYRLRGSLGVEGYGSAPFPEILRLTAEEDGLLHVLYRDDNQQMILASYRDGALAARFASFDPGTEEERRRYFVEREDIAPGRGGAFALTSIALRQKSNYDLVARIIYRQDAPAAAPVELLRIDDPQDYFVWSRPDGGFFLMNGEEDGSRILFKTFSPDGEYLNNRLIVFPGLRAAWRDTFLSLDGRIYSSRLYLGKFELYEWN